VNKVIEMGNYMSARNTHKRTSSDASLDSEVGDDENKRNKKKCASRVKLVMHGVIGRAHARSE